MSSVVVYTMERCPHCKKAKALLTELGVEFEEVVLTEDDEQAWGELEKNTGGKTVPQIVIGGTVVGGYDDLRALYESGQLLGKLGGDVEGSVRQCRESLVTIAGSGPAGLTAALYAGRAQLNPIVIEGPQVGGQLTITSDVENFPGFPEGVLGPELMELFRGQASRFGTEYLNESITHVSGDGPPWTIHCSNDLDVRTHVLIIATGSTARWLGLESEELYRGKGVSACATCDGFFFRDKDVVVVGGGDSALEEALFLTRFARNVSVVHRRDELRASKIMRQRAEENEKLSFIWNSVVVEIGGDGKAVTHVDLKNVQTGETSSHACQGIFMAIGHVPNSAPFSEIVDLDEKGYIRVRDEVYTKSEGIFACGDVCDSEYRQAITAAGSGCSAAIVSERYLAAKNIG